AAARSTAPSTSESPSGSSKSAPTGSPPATSGGHEYWERNGMKGQTTGSSADLTSKKRPLRIAGQLVGPFTTGCGVLRPALPTGSRIATEGSVKSSVAAGGAGPRRGGAAPLCTHV